VGRCKLCLQRKLLADSHFLPAGIIRQCMVASLTNKDAVWVSQNTVKQTSKPIKDYVFCDKCEQRFSNFGEQWTIHKVAQINGQFPILSMLENVRPERETDNMKIYAADHVPEMHVERLVHFGCGLLWKASVHQWKMEGEVLTPLVLDCEEELRQYLHGDCPFPRNVAALIVSVSNAQKVPTGAVLPGEVEDVKDLQKGCRYKTFATYVSGIEFTLWVGQVPDGIMYASAANPPHWIRVSPNAQAMAEYVFRKHLKNGKMSAGTQRTMKEISAIRSKSSFRK
jgi:hypothetical protein